jgi:hypothetical protein
MWRRLYIAVPEAAHAHRVVGELEQAGIDRTNMHTIARRDVDITGLPAATDAQRRDRIWLWDRMIWNGNLVLFGLSAIGLGAAVLTASPAWAVAAGVVMIATFLAGRHFAVAIPHVHLGEMRVPLLHGEVVLMVDVPRARLGEIEQLVIRHHPEAGVGGVGWSLSSRGI